MERYFAAVRDACTKRAWSRGIELARADAVEGVSREEDQACLRVTEARRPVPREVTLWLLDDEWDCDCGGADPCEHVAAATIALKRAAGEGKALPSSKKAGGRLHYRFEREGHGLVLRRFVVEGDTEAELTVGLGSLVSGTANGPAVSPTKEDLTIEKLLQRRRQRLLPGELVVTMLPLLAGVDRITLDGEEVRADTTPLRPEAIVDRKGDTFRLTVKPAAVFVRMAATGVALCEGGVLRPLAETELTGTELQRLPQVQRFGPADVARLVGEVLPEMRKRMTVDVRTPKLPGGARKMPARVLLDVQQEGTVLRVLPLLVYGDPPAARVDGDRLVHLEGALPIRDPRAEQRALERFGASGLELAVGRRATFVGEAASAMAAKIRAYDGAVKGEAHERLYPTTALTPVVATGASDVRFVAGDREADPAAVVQAWVRGERQVPLVGGGWAPLPLSWLSQHGHRVADLLAARRDDGTLAPHGVLAAAGLCAALDRPPPADLGKLAPLLEGFEAMPEPVLPGDLTATLRAYQHDGVRWLSFLRDVGLGAILADDMGLGKTLQALCVLGPGTLVVCPTSLMHNWASELSRFRPSLSCRIHHGPKRSLDDPADVTITSYAILRLDRELLEAREWSALVLDEAQTIKNPESQVAQAAYAMRAAFRLTLTGTPVENRLEELWSQAHFTNPGLLGGRRTFRERVAQRVEDGDAVAAAQLRERLRPFLLRRLKSVVAADLPPRTDVRIPVRLSDEERAQYDAVRAATQKEVVAALGEGGGVMKALEALLRLRQAACHRGLLPGQEAPSSSKLERLAAALEEGVAAGHKALVFSQWTGLLDRVEPHLEASGIGFCRLDGSTRDRAAVVDAFQSEGGPPVMLASLKAGGTGLNLTAADHVFLLDPWWNPAAEDQAADRAHRIGQDKPVIVHRLVAVDTVEERILDLADRKRALADAALSEGAAAASLSRDDLLALLGD